MHYHQHGNTQGCCPRILPTGMVLQSALAFSSSAERGDRSSNLFTTSYYITLDLIRAEFSIKWRHFSMPYGFSAIDQCGVRRSPDHALHACETTTSAHNSLDECCHPQCIFYTVLQTLCTTMIPQSKRISSPALKHSTDGSRKMKHRVCMQH